MIYAKIGDVAKMREEVAAVQVRLKAAEDAVLLHERDRAELDARLRALELTNSTMVNRVLPGATGYVEVGKR